MKRYLLVVSASLMLLVAACGGTPAPTQTPIPTPTPAPTPDILASVTAAIQATAAAAPTVTPIPSPTPTPTPVPTATPTPTPTPTATPRPVPTPTSTPTLDSVIPKVRNSVVQVISGTTQISGVAIEPLSLVLTTSLPLSPSPLVTIISEDNRSLTGWMVGRDDHQNLSLIKITDGLVPGIQLGDSSVLRSREKLLSLHYPLSQQGKLSIRETTTLDDRRDLASGIRLLEMDIEFPKGGSGSPLVNNQGNLVGIVVDASFVGSLNFIAKQENFVLTSQFIETALVKLRGGEISLCKPKADLGTKGYCIESLLETRTAPALPAGLRPQTPAIYRGTVSVNGAAPVNGTRLYARLVNAALGDSWTNFTLDSAGNYTIHAGTGHSGYQNSVVEFYIDGVKAQIRGTTFLDQARIQDGVLRYRHGDFLTLGLSFD